MIMTSPAFKNWTKFKQPISANKTESKVTVTTGTSRDKGELQHQFSMRLFQKFQKRIKLKIQKK